MADGQFIMYVQAEGLTLKCLLSIAKIMFEE